MSDAKRACWSLALTFVALSFLVWLSWHGGLSRDLILMILGGSVYVLIHGLLGILFPLRHDGPVASDPVLPD
ncbi:hypothetical protein GCM10009125_00380 [Castellaniella daejeonensis]|uniref:DUF1145 domain-containing protein n=1 Tax=Castellaniella daejeonensis TaxID=659013 RepID=A0ABN0T8F2_9BURK